MSLLSPHHQKFKDCFAGLTDSLIVPSASQHDAEQNTPPEFLMKLADEGVLGAFLSADCGGAGWDILTQGLLCEEVGRGSVSLLSLLAVHSMVCRVISKWGLAEQKEYWLPLLASGRAIGAFALTEPETGSDARNVKTKLTATGGGFVLNGRKRWISFGQAADVFLVFADSEQGPAAVLVERNMPGITVTPINGLLGFRAAMLAELVFQDVSLPASALVGKPGFGFSHICNTALDQGRFVIAWGSVGLAQACLDASIAYSSMRIQFGVPISEHQMIQNMLSGMIADTRAARALCQAATAVKADGDPASIVDMSIAKFFTSKVAMRAAADALQIHGANGYGNGYPVERYFRDAKALEIIEGSSQILGQLISRQVCAAEIAKRSEARYGVKSETAA